MNAIAKTALRELRLLAGNPIYAFCMVVFPLMVMFFFTSLMQDGQPLEMPVGVVDQDNTSTTRALVRRLDGMQNSRVVARFASVAEARHAIQQNQVYAFLYFPKGTTEKLLAGRQPVISFYYSQTSITSGALLMKDMKTVATLGAAAVGQATLRARGLTERQISTLLQPVTLDVHLIENPWTNYNIYLSTMLVPGVIMLFIFLITAYSIGTELKFGTGRQWVELCGGNMLQALLGKLLPQGLIWLIVVLFYDWYVFIHLGFPHPGGLLRLLLLSLLLIWSAQGFGVFAFGLMPSLRMSMSVCSLWAVLSFSMAGSAFPLMAMDGPLQALSWLFPLRHYYMVYVTSVFNNFPLIESWFHLCALTAFTLLPWMVLRKIKNAMLTYVYIP